MCRLVVAIKRTLLMSLFTKKLSSQVAKNTSPENKLIRNNNKKRKSTRLSSN